MYQKDTCSIRIQMEEGDLVVEEEAGLVKAETTKDNPMKKNSTANKMLQTRRDIC